MSFIKKMMETAQKLQKPQNLDIILNNSANFSQSANEPANSNKIESLIVYRGNFTEKKKEYFLSFPDGNIFRGRELIRFTTGKNLFEQRGIIFYEKNPIQVLGHLSDIGIYVETPNSYSQINSEGKQNMKKFDTNKKGLSIFMSDILVEKYLV